MTNTARTEGVTEAVRRFWDVDAATYDDSSDHYPRSPAELAAWSAAFLDLLPPAPAHVLDAGAGTGFLSLNLARLGYRVTALDIAPTMLERLKRKAQEEGAAVDTVEGSAADPPEGPFDAVVERHVLWTLPDPVGALAAWRAVAPDGRLALFEALWGGDTDPAEKARRRARALVTRLRRDGHAHHGSYDADMLAALPLSGGPGPERLLPLVETTWGPARLRRLRDVEWAMTRTRPQGDQLLGVMPRFAITAGSTG